MLTIVGPREFRHAADLSAKSSSTDPRNLGLEREGLVIDLRRCEFVRPAAVLWCAVYGSLARNQGIPVRLLVPENLGVSVYLKSVGLFRALQECGIDVDDRGVGDRVDHKIVLPVTRFGTETEVEELANVALERVVERELGASNLRPIVAEVFAELAMNAVQHAESPIPPFGLIQFYGFGATARFVCVVADGGIGIRRSLERNPSLRNRVPYDWVAIELATRELVSGTGDPHRGIGLYQITEDMRQPGRRLILHSGIGMLSIDERAETAAKRVSLFPGTLAFASVPT